MATEFGFPGPTGMDAALGALLAPALGPVLRPPVRRADSAWYGHVPFGQWLVAVAAPRRLVELGTHAGVSYSCFCETVLQERLATACAAVDTWRGDAHAGFYADDIYEEFRAFHDARYGSFSRLLRCSFDEALVEFADGSVDLLHIDGRHAYEDVCHDFEVWQPKLSSRAIVLLHDIAERERGFGVWRLFAELARNHPSFAFTHSHGLGVLAIGADAPPVVGALCALADSALIETLRERFAWLGARWESIQERRELERSLAHALARKTEIRNWGESVHQQLIAMMTRCAAAESERDALRAERAAAAAAAAAGEAALATVTAELEQLRRAQASLQDSRSWRLTAPLRAASAWLQSRRPGAAGAGE